MRPIVLAVAAVLAAAPARAEDGDEDLWRWTKIDTAAQATVIALIAVDWMQTITFTQHPTRANDGYEGNRVLGRNPSRAKVNTLIPLGALAHTAIAIVLPKPMRQAWQAGGVYLEIDATRSNYRAGVTMTLPWK